MSYKKVTHVIFDVDGVLLDSEALYEQIIENIGKPFGKHNTSELKLKLLGRDEHDAAKITIADMELPYSEEKFLEIYRGMARKLLKNLNLMPGAKRLVEHFHKHKVPIGIATSSSKEDMDIKTVPHQQVFKLFHHMVCGTDNPEIKKGKPAPDIYLSCASKFPDAPKPDKCLVFEDAPNGVTGAIAAGMQVVIVPVPHITQEQSKHATLRLNSLEEFQPELFGLPPFK